MPVVKLSEIKDVVLQVEVKEGDVRDYDPFVIIRKLEPWVKKAEQGNLSSNTEALDQIKAAFDLPDITDQQAVHLVKCVTMLVEEELASKELRPVQPS